MAERRLQDRAAGLPEEECGWLTTREIGDWFGYTPALVQMHVFYMRQALRAQGVEDFMELVVRRTVSRTIRLSIGELVIDRR
jgi:hypothetical protein